MTVKRSGLGRNLSALLGNSTATVLERPATELIKLPINQLQPGKYQPRSDIDEASLTELAASIKQQGLLQPLIVREMTAGRYEILAGERRWRASQLAELSEIPVIVRQVDDETALAIALVENLQREDLNVMDQARSLHRLTSEFGLTHQQVADLVSKSRTAVSNFMRLLSLNPEVKRFLEQGELDMGHARALLVLEGNHQTMAAQLVIARNLSVRETEKLVARIKAGKSEEIQAEKELIAPSMQDQLSHLAQQLKTKINIRPAKAGKGTLIIHYDNLPSLIEKLMK